MPWSLTNHKLLYSYLSGYHGWSHNYHHVAKSKHLARVWKHCWESHRLQSRGMIVSRDGAPAHHSDTRGHSAYCPQPKLGSQEHSKRRGWAILPCSHVLSLLTIQLKGYLLQDVFLDPRWILSSRPAKHSTLSIWPQWLASGIAPSLELKQSLPMTLYADATFF